jgi:hypothetical protein
MRAGKFLVALLVAVFVIGAAGSASALSSYVSTFSSTYPGSATASFSCSICHTSVPALNGYGTAYANAGHNFKTIESQDSDGDGATNIAEITAGTNPGDPNSKPAPTPVACTGYTYSAWSACGTNGQQTRTVIGYTPSGCSGTPSTAAALTQACSPTPVACAGYTYSAWSACGADGQQTRTVIGYTPSGCSGTPSTSPLLNQICNYVPPVTPPPTGQNMPVPTSRQVFTYEPVNLPVLSSDPAQAKPVGVGPVADGGDTADINVQIGPFEGPVDVSFVIYAPALDPEDLYFLNTQGELKRLSRAVEENEASRSSEESSSSEGRGGRVLNKFGNLIRWKDNVTGVDENIFTTPVKALPSGQYTLVLVVKSSDDDDHYYRWVTNVTIPENKGSYRDHDDD